MTDDTLIYLAARPREAVVCAKSWLMKNGQPLAATSQLNEIQTVEAIEEHYPGGWAALCADTGNTSSRDLR